MKQHLLTLFLALAASVGTLFAQSGTCGDNLTWTLDTESGILTISGTGAMTDYTYNSSNGKPNTPWYSSRTSIKTVILPDGVTSIGQYAFSGCSSLTSITIPNSVTSIGNAAFGGCSSLTSVHISDIAAWCKIAFSNANANPLSYAHNLYLNGTLITDLVIPDGVTSIGSDAFYGCSSLTSITIPNSVTSIGDYAFDNCSSLTSITIPNSVTSIGWRAFGGCTSLTSVTIPNSVTSIGQYAFYYCSSLTSVTIPNSVTSIGDFAFCYCRSLTSIMVDYGNPNYCDIDGVLFNKNKTELIIYPIGKSSTDYIIPNSVTSIGDLAFFYCGSLTSVTIPNSVTSIGGNAFYDCSSLTSITIPNSVTSIGDLAFYNCSSLTSITIPNSVTSIGDGAFRYCSGLTSVTIGNSVTSIGDYAFSWCTGLTSLTCEAVAPPTLKDGVFDRVDKSIPLYVPAQSIDLYKAADQWKDFNVQAIAEEQQGGTTDDYCFDIAKLGERDVFRCIDADFGVVSESNVNMMFGWKYSYSSKNHSRHTLITKPGKDDICGELDVLPSGKIASVRMAADSYTETDNAKGAICGYYVDVTENNAVVTLQYAAVMHNPKHEIAIQNGYKDYAQPYIKIEVLNLDEESNFLDEFTISHYPSDASTIEGWKSGYDADGNAFVWKDWSDVTFDFSEYIGKRIAICFSTYDCAESGYNSENQNIVICKNRHQAHLYFTFNQICDLPEDMLAGNKMTVNYQDYSVTYELNADTAIVVDVTSESLITEYEGMVCLKKIDVVIPEQVNYNGKDYTVTSIGAFATVNMPTLYTLTLPATVTSTNEFGLAVPYAPYYPNDENSKRYSEFMSEVTINTLSPIFIDKYLITLSADNLDWDMFQNAITAGMEKVNNARNKIAQLQSQLTEFADAQNIYVGCVPYKQFFNIQESVRLLNTRLEVLQECSDMYERMEELCKRGRKVEGGYVVLEETNMLAVEIARLLHGFNLYVPTSVASAYTQESETYWKLQDPVNPEKYRFTVKTSDPSMGYVCEVDDYFTQHAQLTISAFPNSDLYRFIGWSDGNTDNPRTVTLTSDMSFTADFECVTWKNTDGITVWEDQLPYVWEGISFTTAGTETKTLQTSDGCDSTVTFTLRVLYRNITLQENESSDYYTQFAQDYNGVTVTTATLNRQFTQGKWSTLCLPFNVNKALMTSLGLYNRVFELRYAEQLDDETIQMYFAPAQTLEAGKGYIVNPNAKLAAKTSFVFPNVTINTDADNGDITSLTGYNDGTNRGNLYLVGTLRTGILQGSTTGNTYLGLKDNQLYYPNTTSGTSIRAYRGFFRSDIPVNASRVRIIANGESVTELEVMVDEQGRMDNGQLQNNATPARKYIEKGILYIERNGITYTAQGQRID